MSTKTPSTKAKKPAAAKGAGKPAAKPAKAKVASEDEAKKKKAKGAAKPGGAREDGEGEGEGEEEDDEDEFLPQAGAKKAGKPAVEPTAVVPARRLTPEAKAAINAMVAKGVPLDEALRRAGSWETFVAPVKDETQKAFPGKEGGGPRSPFGGRRPSGPRDKSEVPPREPGGGGGFGFEDDDAGGISLGDDEPIVAGGDDD